MTKGGTHMLDKLKELKTKYEQLTTEISDPNLMEDQARYTEVLKNMPISNRLFPNTRHTQMC
jgi:protein subunit release factor A